MLKSVFTATKADFVAVWGRHFPTYPTEPKDDPSISFYFVR